MALGPGIVVAGLGVGDVVPLLLELDTEPLAALQSPGEAAELAHTLGLQPHLLR
jgi:hypothetical protein